LAKLALSVGPVSGQRVNAGSGCNAAPWSVGVDMENGHLDQILGSGWKLGAAIAVLEGEA
jgi:hypothetical protein